MISVKRTRMTPQLPIKWQAVVATGNEYFIDTLRGYLGLAPISDLMYGVKPRDLRNCRYSVQPASFEICTHSDDDELRDTPNKDYSWHRL